MSAVANSFQFDDVTVDCADFRIRKNGQAVMLTPRAFDVLLLLIKNDGRVVEKQEIFDKVWKEAFVGDNALTRVVKEIRQALDDDAAHPRYIETVPKRGYRFIAPVSAASLESETVAPATIIPEDDLQQAEHFNLSSRPVLITLLIILGLGTTAFFYFTRGNSAKEPIGASLDSIAVLPFANEAQDPGAEYLSDGITESLINRLSSLSNLRVVSRGSAFRYKDKEQDPQKVGSELNVRAVLTGSVKQIGDQLVINISLDDAQNDRHIWGEQYVRKFSDVLAVQSDIAQAVTANLRVKLTGADEQQLAKRYTGDPEAYQLYLRGMYEWKKHTLQDFQKAIEYFNQALERDPNFALAYEGLSASYGALANNYLPPNETFPKAKAYAARALELDDTLSDTHEAMGAVRLYYDWDWPETEKELQQAESLNPNDAVAPHLYADYYDAVGRFDEAQAQRKRSLDLDPLSPLYNMAAGADFYYARQYDRSIEQLEKTINLEPRYVLAHLMLGQAYEQKKMYPEAIAALEKGIMQSERHPYLIAALGHVYASAGEREKALETLAELHRISKQRYISPYLFAVVYVGLGDKGQTLAWLEKALNERSSFMIWLKAEPQFDSVRDDPQFQNLVRRIVL